MGSAAPPPIELELDGLLFDMDGTLIDSTDAVVKHWHTIGKEIGVDPEVILKTSHGRRSIDMLKIISPERANWEYVRHMEGLLPKLYGDDATEIPGARPLLEELIRARAPWAIVTSGTVPLVTGWLGRLGLPQPEVLVTAESVENGKPDPACYALGRERLLGAPEASASASAAASSSPRILVFEDSPAGIRAGKAAGCKVLGLVTSHTREQVAAAEPDWIVTDLESVKMIGCDNAKGTVTLQISGADL